MEKEISSGAMLGIVLIALAAIIGLGFGIFAIAKGTANEGVVNVQDTLGQVSASTFNDYDQKIVTGTQVMSAYSNFLGKPYAIVVATQAYIDGLTPVSGAPVSVAYAGAVGSATRVTATNSSGASANLGLLNYNAQLGPSGNIRIYLSNGVYTAASGFDTDAAGKIRFNSVTANLSKTGMVEYVPSSGRFQANLIKDASGTIMGIALQQVAQK